MLQRKFNLWDKQPYIPNLTTLTYKQLSFRPCRRCNNEVYGKLEERVSKGLADDKDIWRWANKIHFGLRLKDKFLEWDRKSPGKKIGDVLYSSDYLEQSRHFLHCITNDFSCHPDPLGRCLNSSIYICTGSIAYIVFVTDGHILKKDDIGISQMYENLASQKCEMKDALFFHAQLIYYMEQHTFSNPIVFSEKGITKLGRATLRNKKELDKELFRAICERFGITWIDEDTL